MRKRVRWISFFCAAGVLAGALYFLWHNTKEALDGARRLRVAVTDGFVSPSEQTGPYFTLSLATELTLPWVLDEPFPRPPAEEAAPKPKGIWKLFQK